MNQSLRLIATVLIVAALAMGGYLVFFAAVTGGGE